MSDLKQAIKLIKAGEKQKGGQLLKDILKSAPNNEMAWLWMSQAVSSRKHQIQCLKRVLAINPDNAHAQQGLAKLEIKNNRIEPDFVTPAYEPETALVSGSEFQEERTSPKSSLGLGCLGGLLATGLSAGIWAIITVITDYQIG